MLTFLLTSMMALSSFSRVAEASSSQTTLRVSTYNVAGLPWPIRKNPKARMKAITAKLKEMRTNGIAPDVVVLQEAFIKDAGKILERAGYPYIVKGPSSRDFNSDDLKACRLKGHKTCSNGGKYLNSGLYIGSEFPITRSAFEVFGRGRCTGWDCYSNKGVQLVEIKVPGIIEPIQILNTHMQSIGSSGSSDEKGQLAQKRQLEVLKRFMHRHVNYNLPVIFPGDFNIRTTQPKMFLELTLALPLHNAGVYCDQPSNLTLCKIKAGTDPLSLHRSPDHHYWRASDKTEVVPVLAEKNMNYFLKEKPFSDHLAFEIKYRLSVKD